jgi:hypothetical protein
MAQMVVPDVAQRTRTIGKVLGLKPCRIFGRYLGCSEKRMAASRFIIFVVSNLYCRGLWSVIGHAGLHVGKLYRLNGRGGKSDKD